MSDKVPLEYYNLDYENNQKGGEDIDEADVLRHQQMSIYNDRYLNYMEPSKTSLYNIPRGTILHDSLHPYISFASS